LSRREAAQRFGVGVGTAITGVQRWGEAGSIEAGQVGGHRPKKLTGAWRSWLLERCHERAFTLRGLVGELAERGLGVDDRSVWRFVHAERLTHKKAPDRQRAGPRRCGAPWLRHRGAVDPRRLGFIDEAWVKTNMAPLRGWAPRGRRLKANVPHRRWKTTALLAALRRDGVQAPWLIAGPSNGERFRLCVEPVLAPTLRPTDIVSMVSMDNLGGHKSQAVRRAIRATGAKLFRLPKCSPDLNPIETLFAKLKHWLRQAAGRSVEVICGTLAETLNAVTATECRNYFVQAGYDPT
jgi:transposase